MKLGLGAFIQSFFWTRTLVHLTDRTYMKGVDVESQTEQGVLASPVAARWRENRYAADTFARVRGEG